MSARTYDQNGFFEVKANPLSRIGVFPYLGKQLGLEGDDAGKIFQVYRPAEELGHPDCVNSFRLLPFVDDHTMLGPDAMAAEEKGVHGVIGDEVFYKDGWLYGNIRVFSNALSKLLAAGKREISAGYRCVYEMTAGVFNGVPYDAIQRTIRGNHLALVKEGRMGPAVAVMDSFTFTFDAKDAYIMADKDPKDAGAKPAMTLEEVVQTLGELAPQVAAMNAAMAKLSAAPVDKPAVVDEKKPEGGMPAGGEKPVDAAVIAADATKAATAAMDAALKPLLSQVGELATVVAALKTGGAKTYIGEVAARDALATRLAPHIGTFDHADKTLSEVAAYGVEKLGLKPPAGAELVAIESYLHARPAAGPTVTHGDGMDAAPGDNFVTKQIAAANAKE